MLPPRTNEAEDQFLRDMAGVPADVVLSAAIQAVEDGRPMLSARLIGLLPPDTDLSDAPGLQRAQQAARFLLLAPADRRGPVIEALEEALSGMKARYLRRATKRQRQRASGKEPAPGQRRKPRRTRG